MGRAKTEGAQVDGFVKMDRGYNLGRMCTDRTRNTVFYEGMIKSVELRV